MKKKIAIRFVLLFFILIQSVTLYSQISKPDQETYYDWFDTVIGVGNIGIYNGVEYEKKYRTIGENHEFFTTSKFLKGDIIYESQPYYNIDMKYDIYEDDIIVKLPSLLGGNIIIKLIKGKINSFNLLNKQFVRVYPGEVDSISKMELGLHQILYEGKYLKLYKKHRKSKVERSDKDFIYNSFKENNETYIFYKQNYYRVKSKSDFVKVFPELKKSINTYYKSKKALRKSDIDKFAVQLSKYIESLLTFNEAKS